MRFKDLTFDLRFVTFDPNHQYLVDARGVKFRFMAIGVEMKIKLDQPTTYFYIFRKWRYVVLDYRRRTVCFP